MSFRIVYMGTPEFAVPPLERLAASGYDVVAVVSQPDRPAGRRMTVEPNPVHRTADRLGIPILQPDKIRTDAFYDWLSSMAPDILVTAAYGRILPERILNVPKLGCLNIHASLLPLYRGASPINNCIIQGETQTGITIMLTDVGMDTGDILSQGTMDIPPDMDAGTLSGLLSMQGAGMIVEAIDDWTSGRIHPQPQDHSRATYTKPMSRDDGRIDWSLPAGDIHNLVRGTTPWPGAFTRLLGKRLKIHMTQVSGCDKDPEPQPDGPLPGTILSTCPDCIRVACGGGTCIEIISLQAEACRRLDARECFHNFRPGTILGGE